MANGNLNRKFLIVIPARRGSKGIPNKNFRLLDGSPVIEYSINHARKFREKCDLLVSSDNIDFLEEFASNSKDKSTMNLDGGSNYVFLKKEETILHHRPSEHAQDNSGIMPLLQSILQELEYQGSFYQGIVLLQPTVPFRSNSDGLELNRYLNSKASVDGSFVTFRKIGDSHPARMYKKLEDASFKSAGIYPEFQQSRRQDLPELFLRDGCYYYIGKNLVKQGIQVGDYPAGYVRSFPWNINLDEESDLIQAHYSVKVVKQLLEQGE